MKKLIFIFSILAFSFGVMAQGAVAALKSTYSLSSDTTVDTGVTYLTSPQVKSPTSIVTVQVVATKISGTVAGTISLQGSLDGTNFKAITLTEASTAGPTYTATDVASQNFIWRLSQNPYAYYRVSWTGAGTMSAKFTANILSR
jgi:hypothetical protein